MTQTLAVPAPIAQPRSRTPWAISAPLVALILVVGIPAGYVLISWSNHILNAPARMTDSLSKFASDAVRPKIDIHEIVLSTLQDVRKTNKLVVAEPIGNIDVTRDDSYSSWGIYWGTNTVRVIARDTRAQFVIDLSKLQSSDIEYATDLKVLTVTIPRPKLDVDMISIDPGKIETVDSCGGWGRFDKGETRDLAIAEMKPRLMLQADTPITRKLAAEAGIEAMTSLLQPLAAELMKDNVSLKVVYSDAK